MARRYAAALEAKGWLRRKPRKGHTNAFDFTPLFEALARSTRALPSDPVPLAHMIGINPTNIVATVMNFGRSRFAAPSTIAP